MRAIPVHELRDPRLVHRGIRRRIIGRRIHADLIFLTVAGIGRVGREPNPGQFLNLVIHPFDRVAVYQPFGGQLGLGRADRQYPKRDGMIGEHMIPGRREVKHQ